MPKHGLKEIGRDTVNFNGKLLKKIREQKGLIQTEICDAIDLHQSLYSKYERGVIKEPPATAIKDIADYLGVPYESFFGEFDEPVLINQTSGIPERIDVHVHVKIDWGF
jgi:transcriptional regulator with XRE-family HTH domain